jgi:hypothetical protein
MPKKTVINEGVHTALPWVFKQKWSYAIDEQGGKYYYRQVNRDGEPVIDPDFPDEDGWCGPYKTIEIAYQEAFSLTPDWDTYRLG